MRARHSTAVLALIVGLSMAGMTFAQESGTARPVAGAIVTGEATYISSPALFNRAFAALIARTGPKPMISRLTIAPDRIILVTQSATAAYYGDEWEAGRVQFLFYDSDQINGPRPARDNGIVARAEGGFFPLSDVMIERIDPILAQAIGYAGIEGAVQVRGIEVARAVSLLPTPSFGEIRWTIRLASEREQATVYANAEGRIIGGDLSGTMRAQRMNLLEEDNWPMDQAQQALASVAGGKPVHEIEISPRSVSVTIEDAANPKMTESFSWDISGLRKSFVGMPNYVALGMGDRGTFGFGEIDMTNLPAIKAAAIAAYAAPNATMTGMQAIKPTDRPGIPKVLWDVDFRESNGETGEVLVDPSGTVVAVNLPDSRRPAMGPWMAPETVVATLKRLEEAFGPTARFSEIMLNDRGGSIVVEDPAMPGQQAQFIIDEAKISRFGSLMPFETSPEAGRTFTLVDLTMLDLAGITALNARTLERMGRQDLAIARYTISRRALIMDPSDSRLLVEIRAEKDDGWTGGWVTYDGAGNEVDVLMP